MVRLLPLFPLQLVAFPGSVIPLHIFEPRYREMVGEAARAGTEFGIVPAQDTALMNVGCTVVVEALTQRYDDGRFDVLTRGRRRFHLLSLNQQKPYLRGEVEYFDDLEPSPTRSFELAQHVGDLEAQIRILRLRSERERMEQLLPLMQIPSTNGYVN